MVTSMKTRVSHIRGWLVARGASFPGDGVSRGAVCERIASRGQIVVVPVLRHGAHLMCQRDVTEQTAMSNLCLPFSLLFSLFGVFSWKFGAARVSHDSHLRVPALQTPPKFHEKTPRERKRAKMEAGEGKKREMLAPTPSGPHRAGPHPAPLPLRPPHFFLGFGPSPFGPHPSGPHPFRPLLSFFISYKTTIIMLIKIVIIKLLLQFYFVLKQ